MTLYSCWKYFSCENKECPAYGVEGVKCWEVENTMCSSYSKHAMKILAANGHSKCDYCMFRTLYMLDISGYGDYII